MNKIKLLIILLLIAGPNIASAVEITSTIKVEVNTGNISKNNATSEVFNLLLQIEALTKQIEKMQLELEVLKKNEEYAVKEGAKVLLRTLTVGTKGEDVKKLQTFLAKDKETYPEGLVTGYYGELTKKAVSKYQEKNGLESVGVVGPKTRILINESFMKSDSLVYKNDKVSIVKDKKFYEGVVLKSDEANGKVYWSVDDSKIESALTVVWSKESQPTYPAREKDIWVYFEDSIDGHLKLEAKDGNGKYFVRVCAHDTSTNTCAFYSNQVEIELN